jgi:hypothetical protein
VHPRPIDPLKSGYVQLKMSANDGIWQSSFKFRPDSRADEDSLLPPGSTGRRRAVALVISVKEKLAHR